MQYGSQFVYACTRAPAQTAAQERESEAPRTVRAQARRLRRNRRSPRGGRRAAHLHADAGGPGARRKSIDLQPPRAAAARDCGNAFGDAARSGRRARAVRNRPTTTREVAPPGRPPVVSADLVRRIQKEQSLGKSLRQIARDLNASQTPTAHDGAQWWPSTVRAVVARSRPLETD